MRKSTILGAGLLEILKIRPAQPPSWGWGLGLSLATVVQSLSQLRRNLAIFTKEPNPFYERGEPL